MTALGHRAVEATNAQGRSPFVPGRDRARSIIVKPRGDMEHAVEWRCGIVEIHRDEIRGPAGVERRDDWLARAPRLVAASPGANAPAQQPAPGS